MTTDILMFNAPLFVCMIRIQKYLPVLFADDCV